jgi:hypothetical protein
MAAGAVAHPSGRLTATFSDSAARQAAYKLVEKGHAPACAVMEAAGEAAFRRANTPFVFVPVDGCSLSLSQASDEKGFGRVGSPPSLTRGAEAMNAVVVAPSGGVPLGIAAHVMWARRHAPLRRSDSRGLPLEKKETRYWLEVLEATLAHSRAAGYPGRSWFQLDAGADARDVLEWAAWNEHRCWVTVRCGQDRRIEFPDEGLLWEVVGSRRPEGTFLLKVPRSEKRQQRNARMAVRFTSVVVRLRDPITEKILPVELSAVHVRETGTCPRAEEPIEWMLLTNRQVLAFEDARLVVRGYSMRWRIEEVHKSWKSGCKVEESALCFGPFATWAALLLCVAVRIERLKRLAREEPETSSDREFNPFEINALLLLSRKGRLRAKDYVPTMGEAVLWLAELGGYTGKSSGGPPGSITLKRGLDKLSPAADLLRAQAERNKRD